MLYPQHGNILDQEIISVAPEIIRDRISRQGVKVHQLLRSAPLRPVLHPGVGVGIQVVDEGQVVGAGGDGGVVRQHTEEHLQQVAAVEGAEHRGAEVVGGEEGPRGHGGGDGRGEVEERTPRQREGEVAEDGGQALELRIDVVQEAGPEGRPIEDSLGVGGNELVDLGLVGVVEEEGLEVGGELVGGRDVGLEEREECSFVFLVADYEGYFGVFPACYCEFGRLG